MNTRVTVDKLSRSARKEAKLIIYGNRQQNVTRISATYFTECD